MIALVDCNSFYASCEKVFRPDLKNKAVLVLSNNDSCVVAMSSEAKALGISRATPLFKMRDLIKKHDIAIFSSNYTLYADLSNRIMQILKEHSYEIEVYSIDEAFLNLKGFKNPVEHSEYLKKLVEKHTGIPVSVGIGKTKTLAKIANHYAKKTGVFYLKHTDNLTLGKTNVSSIWNIGWSSSDFLKSHNIKTALELRDADDWWIKKNLTINGLRTVWELRGKPSIELELRTKAKKGIMTSRQFGRPVKKLEELNEAVAEYASLATEKLRKQNSLCVYITVTVETDPFKGTNQYNNSTTIAFSEPCSYLPQIIKAAQKGLKDIYKADISYKRVRIYLSGIEDNSKTQLSLFNPKNNKETAVMDAVDKINKKHHRQAVSILAKGFDKKWQMKREKLSPRYTSNWNEILQVK